MLIRTSIASLATLAFVVGASAGALAGSLTPPAGPVSPTMKTLDEVEARTPIDSLPGDASAKHVITQPGSYYLTADLQGVSGRHGVVVQADDVTIDLNGFTMIGDSGVNEAIIVTGLRRSLTIRNGHIRGWRGGVVTFSGPGDGALHTVLERLTISGCTKDGALVGAGAIVRDCLMHANSASGVRAEGTNILIERTSMRSNGMFGLHIGQSVVVRDCDIQGNTQGVRSAPDAAHTSRIVRSVISNNTQWGLLDAERILLEDCLIANNGSGGVRIRYGVTIRSCVVEFNNGDGIVGVNSSSTDLNSVVERNIVRGNSRHGIYSKHNQSGMLTFGNISQGNTLGQIFMPHPHVAPLTNNPSDAGPWHNVFIGNN